MSDYNKKYKHGDQTDIRYKITNSCQKNDVLGGYVCSQFLMFI